MFRYLFQFIALLLFFAVARSVLTWILKTVMSSFRTATTDPPASAGPRGPEILASAGELHQDPVCGTFVPGTSTWTRSVDGRTVYFCSPDCREKFLVSAHS